ncbi:low molecular weight protein tyrosine phosphatase family protein [Chitinibacteraceae bacterium HSL-7]
MIRALFVCTQNRLRSPTAEHLFADYDGVSTDSAGLGHEAEVPLSTEHLAWATVIFVMEGAQRRRLVERFGPHLKGKQIVVLDIPDRYGYMQDELVALLKRKVEPLLRKASLRRD